MRATTVLIHVGTFLGFLLGAIVLAPRIVHSEGTNWSGLFVQLQQTILTQGSNDLSFENGKYRINISIYEMGLDPKDQGIQSVALGYRHELGESRMYLGVKGAIHFGSFAGSEEWSAHDGDLGTRIDFASKTLYTLGVEIGVELLPKILGYVGGGIAASDMTICGQAHVLEHSMSSCTTGFAPGLYASIGGLADIGKGWALGGELQYIAFRGKQEIDVEKYDFGNLNMDVGEFLVKVNLEKHF